MPLDGDEDSWPGWEPPRWKLPPMDIMYWPGLQEAGEARCYGTGETVTPAGRPPGCVQVIDDGLVRVTAHAGRGEDAFLRACGPGEVLGEELLLPLGGRPGGRRIAAVALTACTTLAVGARAAFPSVSARRPALSSPVASAPGPR
jgi:CRP-like cAMP-binding protein